MTIAQELVALNTSGNGGGSTPPLEWSEAYYQACYQSVLASIEPYQRPSDWLTLPTMVDGDSKFIGLLAVYPNSNYVALLAAGNYTVNWGDGTVEDFAANVKAQRNISFTAPALDGTDAPVTIATDGTISRTNHGRVEGERISLYNVANVTEIESENAYYVRDATANSFKLSLTAGGVAITFATEGTAALLPYKQAIVQLTPQAEQTLTMLNLQQKHSAITGTTGASNFLDIKVGGPFISTLRIGSSDGTPNTLVKLGLLEQIEVYQTAVSSASNLFFSLTALKNLNYFNAAAVTNMNYMFSNCYLLQSVPLFNTAAVTSMSYMFQYCQALKTVPLFNTAAVTSMSYMFYNCGELVTIPALNLNAVTYIDSFVTNCASLSRIEIKNIKLTFAISNCKLDATALNELYTNLSTVTAKIITVTGNPGVTGDNPSIATAKGWTVTV